MDNPSGIEMHVDDEREVFIFNFTEDYLKRQLMYLQFVKSAYPQEDFILEIKICNPSYPNSCRVNVSVEKKNS